MIRTHELRALAVRLSTDPGTAVPAAVEEGTDAPVVPAHYHDRVSADLHGEIAAWAWNLAGVPHEQPFLVENQLEIRCVERLVAIEVAGQRRARLTLLQ